MLAKLKTRRAAKRRSKVVRGLSNIELPSFSATVLRALEMLRSDDHSLAAVGTVVASDPNSSLKILRVANSSSVGLRRQVETVPHAAMLLGRDSLEVILVAAAVSAAVPSPNSKHFDSHLYWTLAAKRASVARQLALRLSPADAMLSFTIALLQDIAVPLLISAKGDEYGDVLNASETDTNSLSLLEREVFGWDHAEVGFDLAKAWEMPDRLAQGIADHHSTNALVAVSLASDLDAGTDTDLFVAKVQDGHALASDELLAMLALADSEALELLGSLR